MTTTPSGGTQQETLNPPNANNYGYDVLDRLALAVLPSTSYGYSYDALSRVS